MSLVNGGGRGSCTHRLLCTPLPDSLESEAIMGVSAGREPRSSASF